MPDFISPLRKQEEDAGAPQPLTPPIAPSYTIEEATKLVESGQPAPPASQIPGLPEPYVPKPKEPSAPVTPLSQEDEFQLLNSGVDPAAVQTLREDRASLAQEQMLKARREYAQDLLRESEVGSISQWQADKEREDHQAILDHSEPVDPLEMFDDDALAKEENFDPKVYAANNPDVLQDNKKVARLAEIYRKRFMEPITGKDVAVGVAKLPAQAVKQVYHLGKGLAFMLGDVFSAPLTGALGAVTGQDPEFFSELNKISEQNLASDLVGLEKGSYNFFSWAKSVPERTLRRLGYDKWEDIPAERIQEEFRNDVSEFMQGEAIGRGEGEDPLFKPFVQDVLDKSGGLDASRVQAVEQSDPAGFLAFGAAFRAAGAAGKAAVGKVGEAAGVQGAVAGGRELTRLRRAVAQMEESVPASSPALAYAKGLVRAAETDVGKAGRVVSQVEHMFENAQRLVDARLRYNVALGAANRLATPEAQAAAQAAEQSLRAAEQQVSGASRLVASAKQAGAALTPQEIGKQVAGRTLQATGAAARGAGRVAGIVPPVVTAGFAIKQALAGNIFYALGALGGAKALGVNAMGRAARARLNKWGTALSAVGRRVAESRPASSIEKAIMGISQGSGEVVAGALKGVPLDVGFGLALAQTPDEVRNLPAFGTAFGALHAAHRPVQRFVEQLRVAPQEIQNPGRATRSAPGAPIRQGANADRQGRRLLNEEGEARINSIEGFLESVGSDTPVYVMPSSGAFFDVLRQNFIRANGREPNAQESADLRNYSAQRGIFTEDIVGDNGQRGSAIFITSLEAAPHEGAHAFQSVLGESGNQVVDSIIFDRYAGQWEQIGQQYVSQLTGQPPSANWRADLQQFVPGKIRDGVGGDPVAAADVYLAREIAAENFSTLFESTGGDVRSRQGVLGDIAEVIDRTARFFGVNLFEGFQTPGEIGISPEGATLGAIQKQAQQARVSPERAPQTPPTPEPPGRPPTAPGATRPPRGTPPTPAQEPVAGEEARAIASQAPEAPLPGATQSPREILGVMADAIAGGYGVQTAYRSAPTAPGASVEAQRVIRRAEIERSRSMPEDVRRMVFNTGFPYRVEVTPNGVRQVLQWSPDMLAANALRWSRQLSELARREPNAPELQQIADIGLELDRTTGEWTADSWRKILRDATTFSENQRAGFTGAGGRLEVPGELRGAGIFGPPEEGRATPMDQGSADFINMLYNLRVPSTPRITGRVLPRNIVAQRVSEATEPGRVVEPAVLEPLEIPVRRRGAEGAEVRERFGELGGRNLDKNRAAAEALGILGEPILEVNPLRANLEKALQRHGIPLPEGIEVVQRLNVDHIANVIPEPNLPRTAGGNVLTLTAGFLPQAKPGNVVLYRGEEGTGAVAGTWWTRNPEKAAQFAAGGTVSAIEVPATVAEAGKRAAERSGQGGDTYVLPPEVGRNAQSFRLEPPTFDLDAQFIPRRRAGAQLREIRRRELDEAKAAAEAAEPLPKSTGEVVITPDAKQSWLGPDGTFYPLPEGRTHMDMVPYVVPGQAPGSPVDYAFARGFARVTWVGGTLFVNKTGTLTARQKRSLTTLAAEGGFRELEHDTGARSRTIWKREGEEGLQFQPASSAGTLKKSEVAKAKKMWAELGTDSPYFKNWFGESKVVDIEGQPLKVYHGTTHKFNVFDPERANIENDLGKGIYLSSDRGDVGRNYAGRGPDLNARIQKRAEEIQWQLENDRPNLSVSQASELALKQAEKELQGPVAREIPAYLKFENPAIVGKNKWNPEQRETFLEMEMKVDENGDFIGEPSGKLVEFMDALRFNEWGIDVESVINRLTERGYDGIYLSDAIRIVKNDPYTEWGEGPGGAYVTGEVIRQALEKIGFDGIIDNTVGERFARMGLGPSTSHFIAFRPDQIKSAEGRGTFDPKNLDIRFLPAKDKSKPHVAAAAIKLADGGILTGPTHFMIYMEAVERGLKHTADPAEFAFYNRDGFVDNTGKFLTREEAFQLAERAGQVPESKREDVQLNEGQLESEGFRENRQFLPKALEEKVSPEEIAVANKTARVAGVVGKGATKTTKTVIERVDKNESVLDFGAGPPARQSEILREAGFKNVTSHEFGANVREGIHDANALSRKYDTVFASNVLNVQASNAMLNRTLSEIASAVKPDGRALFNYPKDPRKNPTMTPDQLLEQIKNHFGKVERVSGTKQEPVLEARQPKGTVPESQALPKEPAKRLLTPEEWSSMDKEARESWFPEAIIPEIKTKRQKNKKGEFEEVELHQKIPHQIVDSPRAKQFVDKDGKFNEEAAVEDFAVELLKRYEQRRMEPEVQAGEQWYESFFPLLQAHYKGDAPLLAELLAATSPNTPPRTNFYFADLALKQWKAGEFDSLIAKYQEGLELAAALEPQYGGAMHPKEWTGKLRELYEADVPENKRPQKPSPATYFGWWMAKYDLLPRQPARAVKGGKEVRPKFGFHGERVLEVITRRWMEKNAGPKTKNFVSNLTGEGIEATIDVWAARTMRELGWKGFVDRWRVLPINEPGVSNPDFFFSQKVFKRAAEKIGILPRMIQGGLWFLEKVRWFEEGWGRLDLGDYKTELERIIKREQEGVKEEGPAVEEEIGADEIRGAE